VNDLEFRKKQLIKEIVDNPLFADMIRDMKQEFASAMLLAEDIVERDNLFYQAKVVDKFVEQLTRIANEIRMLNVA